MRDVERLREKVGLSLDDRQGAAVAICALLLLGTVFSLGIVLGKKLAPPPAATAAGDLAALDAQAHAPVTARPAQPAPPVPEKAQLQPELVRAASLIAPASRAPTVVPAPPRPAQLPAAASPFLPPPREVGKFTVQVGATQDRAEAARLEGRARGAGLKAYVVEANLGAKGTWYRVRVGAFEDREAAGRYRADVERELRIAAVVMPTH